MSEKPDPLKVALGGETIQVNLSGETQEVTVRFFKIAEYPEYLRRIEDEEALAEFACSKEPGWAAQLSVDSILDICEKAHELNFSQARRWGERRAKINQALLPVALQGHQMQETLERSAPKQPSSSKNP